MQVLLNPQNLFQGRIILEVSVDFNKSWDNRDEKRIKNFSLSMLYSLQKVKVEKFVLFWPDRIKF